MSETIEIIDGERIGRKGYPRHYQAFGLEPPMKTVTVEPEPGAGPDVEPPAPPPPSNEPADYDLRRWEFHAMVRFLGIRDAILAVIDTLPTPMARAVAVERFENSDYYSFQDPLMAEIRAGVEAMFPDLEFTVAKFRAAWMQIVAARGASSKPVDSLTKGAGKFEIDLPSSAQPD